MNNIRICCNVNICKNKLQKHCRANGNNHLRHLAENNICDKFWSQYFLAQFSFENFGISICQRRSKCFDLPECALEKACLQRGGPSELSLGRANISTASWKSINKAQTETYRGKYWGGVEMCPRRGERNNTERQDPEIKAKWTKQKVEQQETLGKHAFISSNLQQGKV